jgi:hypothetical protein
MPLHGAPGANVSRPLTGLGPSAPWATRKSLRSPDTNRRDDLSYTDPTLQEEAPGPPENRRALRYKMQHYPNGEDEIHAHKDKNYNEAIRG